MNFLAKIPVLKEFEWFEWFEWFGPSPIEPFNSADNEAMLSLDALFTEATLSTGCTCGWLRDVADRFGELAKFAKFWRARSRPYRSRFLQANMRLAAFFKFYTICALLHRSKLNILATKLAKKLTNLMKFEQKHFKFCNLVKFTKIQNSPPT